MPDGSYSFVVVLGIEVTENLFVAPDGRWIGRYEPTALKSYPFAMVPTKEAQLTLCFDSKTDLIAAIPHGQPIFDAPGQPTEAIRTIMDGMVRAHQDMAAARAASAQLHELGLIKPWHISLRTSRGEKRIEGLFQVDEAALNALDDAAFLLLRRSGALLMAYCQLLSTHNLNILAQLANNRPAVPTPLSAPVMELDFSRLGG